MITVFLAEDEPYVMDELSVIMEANREIRWIGYANNELRMLKEIEEKQPDILLLDLELPTGVFTRGWLSWIDPNPLKRVRKVGEIAPETDIIIVTGHDRTPLAVELMVLNRCVRGYILKDDQESQIVPKIIKHVLDGNRHISESVERNLRTQPLWNGERPKLTERQLEILWEIVINSDASQVAHAERLSISVNTLKKHLSTIYRILSVKNIQSCILKCLLLGYLPISVIESELLEVSREEAGA